MMDLMMDLFTIIGFLTVVALVVSFIFTSFWSKK